MLTVCKKDLCAGCMACVSSCPQHAIEIKADALAYNAAIQEEKCTHCGRCHDVCPVNHPVQLNRPLQWHQGWTTDANIWDHASSGGAATALAANVIDQGGKVFSCKFCSGEFIFGMASTREELRQFQGSKYVKSAPQNIYKDIRQTLEATDSKPVLVIALPCQIAAIKKVIPEKYHKNLLTIDLICHGTPAPELLEKFLNQYHINLHDLKDIQFRSKGRFHLAPGMDPGKRFAPSGVGDCYIRAYLEGAIYTENCYACPYARRERVSDVTLGDSWGTELEGIKEGEVSLILCNTDRGVDLVQNAGLELKAVDIDKAAAKNQTLNAPSVRPENREVFLKAIQNGMAFNKALARYYPKIYIKYVLKRIYMAMPVDPLRKKTGGGNPSYGICVWVQDRDAEQMKYLRQAKERA